MMGSYPKSEQGAKWGIPLNKTHYPDAYFEEEVDGWHGYIEWEKYPEKKAEAAKILSKYSFADVRSPLSLLNCSS